MSNTESLQLFDGRTIRTAWDEKEEKWYFSIIDIIGTVVETDRPRKYWSDLKKKLTEEGSEVSEKIGRLKMTAPDGKMRMTDVADPEQLCRIPNCPINQAMLDYRRLGYSEREPSSVPLVQTGHICHITWRECFRRGSRNHFQTLAVMPKVTKSSPVLQCYIINNQQIKSNFHCFVGGSCSCRFTLVGTGLSGLQLAA